MFLEIAREVLGILKAQLFGHLRHCHAAHHQTLGAVDEEALDDAGGTVAGGVAHNVSKVARR